MQPSLLGPLATVKSEQHPNWVDSQDLSIGNRLELFKLSGLFIIQFSKLGPSAGLMPSGQHPYIDAWQSLTVTAFFKVIELDKLYK